MDVIDLLAKEGSMPNSSAFPKKKSRTALDGLFRYAEFLRYGDIYVKFDHETGLRAIVAIHNLNRGPAIGGCRLAYYNNADAALEDAMRLGYMMSYKAAISNLAHGGAKAVLIKPKVIKDRKAYFQAFGRFVNELGGRYITAMDSGTDSTDMDNIALETQFVTCTTTSRNSGDPSPFTAIGVRRGMEAAAQFKLGRKDLAGLHITIQGVGHVGYFLAKDLYERGARLTICDVNEKSVQHCVDEFKATVVAPDKIFDVPADIFAPCAMGAALNADTIKRLRVKIVAGSANNQLAHSHHSNLMHEKGILYAPDFLVNSGGLIYVASIYDHDDVKRAFVEVEDIYDTIMEVFERAATENKMTNIIAEEIAKERLMEKVR